MAASLSLFSGFRSDSTVPAGRAAKAAFVGAKTVKGPSPLSVSTNPAALTAATSVEKSGLPAAMSTMAGSRAVIGAHPAREAASPTPASPPKSVLRSIVSSLSGMFRCAMAPGSSDGTRRTFSHRGHDHGVDHVDHAIRGLDVGRGDVRRVNLDAALGHDRELGSRDGSRLHAVRKVG